MKKLKAIILEGGFVQGIISDKPSSDEYIIIDYDSDGSDDVIKIDQGNMKTADALARVDGEEESFIPLLKIYKDITGEDFYKKPTRTKLHKMRLDLIKEINKKLALVGWKIFLDQSINGNGLDIDIKKLGDDFGYIMIVDCSGKEMWSKFDYESDGKSIGFCVDNEILRSSSDIAFDIMKKTKERMSSVSRKEIDFDELFKIKQKNNGIVLKWDSIPDTMPEEFFKYVNKELETCTSFNRATHVYGSFSEDENQASFWFSVDCEAILAKPSYNWHMQDVSQTLYNGAITLNKGTGDVRSNH